jgi:hypothetical protein
MSQGSLRDRFWVWGHDAGCHHTPDTAIYKIPGVNKMGPWEGAEYLGIPNCCRVVFNGVPKPPFDEESKKLVNFKKVVWSVLGDALSTRNDDGGDDLEEVLLQAEKYDNIVGGVLDDFFRPAEKSARLSIERINEVADRLHNAKRPLELWLVFYAGLFGIDYSEYLKAVDVVTFWSWDSVQLAAAEENLNKIIDMTPGKKHYAGCYLYNYGDGRELTLDEMKFQLNLYRDMLHSNKIQGVIACSNTVADLGLEAVEYFRDFMKKYGDESVGK